MFFTNIINKSSIELINNYYTYCIENKDIVMEEMDRLNYYNESKELKKSFNFDFNFFFIPLNDEDFGDKIFEEDDKINDGFIELPNFLKYSIQFKLNSLIMYSINIISDESDKTNFFYLTMIILIL